MSNKISSLLGQQTSDVYKILLVIVVSVALLATAGIAASADLDRSVDETELKPGASTTVTVAVTTAEESRIEVIEEFDPAFSEVVIQDTNPDPVIESVRDENDGIAVFWEETDTATVTYAVTVSEDADAGDTFELVGAESTTTIEVVEEEASVSITTGDVDNLTDSSVTVFGEVTELESSTEATVTVEYGTDGDLDNTVSESVNETGDIEIDLDGLESDTAYEYRFTVEADGVSDEGITNDFVTDASEQDDDNGGGSGAGSGGGGGGGGNGGAGAPVPDDAQFEISASEVNGEADESIPIDVTATITNAGGLSDGQTIELTIDDETVAEEELAIESGEGVTVEFRDVDVSTLSKGEYTYRISTDNDIYTDTLTIGTPDTDEDADREEETADDATAEPTDTPEEELIIDEQTGFGTAVALAALMMVALLASRQQLLA